MLWKFEFCEITRAGKFSVNQEYSQTRYEITIYADESQIRARFEKYFQSSNFSRLRTVTQFENIPIRFRLIQFSLDFQTEFPLELSVKCHIKSFATNNETTKKNCETNNWNAGWKNIFLHLIVLLLDAIQAGFESIAAGIDRSIPFWEVVDASPDVDIILGRIWRPTCER